MSSHVPWVGRPLLGSGFGSSYVLWVIPSMAVQAGTLVALPFHHGLVVEQEQSQGWLLSIRLASFRLLTPSASFLFASSSRNCGWSKWIPYYAFFWFTLQLLLFWSFLSCPVLVWRNWQQHYHRRIPISLSSVYQLQFASFADLPVGEMDTPLVAGLLIDDGLISWCLCIWCCHRWTAYY